MDEHTCHVEAFWQMLHQSRRLRDMVDKKMLPYCARHDVTPMSLRILVTLHFEGAMSVSALADATCTAGTNISALCKRMQADGYLCRQRAAEDERRVLVSLSPTGKALATGFVQECEASGDLGALCQATPEIDTILHSMQSLLTMLEDKGDTA